MKGGPDRWNDWVAARAADRDADGGATEAALDLRGLKCPLPALRTERALRSLRAGAEFVVLADDPLSPLDIDHLCRTQGDALLGRDALPTGGWRFRIRRGG